MPRRYGQRVFSGIAGMIEQGSSFAGQVISGSGTSPPVITSVNFAQGDPAGGGQAIVFTGSGFSTVSGAAGVRFLGTNATSYVVDSDTQITAVLPAHAAATGDATITGSGGSDTIAFEFWAPGQITGIDAYLDADKGVTKNVSNQVSSWIDQSAGAVDFTQATDANKPVHTAATFGTLPGMVFTPNQWVSAPAFRVLAAGFSFFWVAKWTSVDITPTTPDFDVPLTVFGANGASCWGAAGASGGSLELAMFDGTGAASPVTTRGSGLNDGAVRLVGFTSNTTPDRKAYVGATQEGTTDSPAGGYSAARTGYESVGAGLAGADGFAGSLGGAVAVAGVISAGDLTKLYAWARQRWGAL